MTKLGPWLITLAGLWFIGLLFVLWPGLDLMFTGLFWRPGNGFFLADSWWAVAVYRAVPVVTWVTVCGMLLALVLALAGRTVGRWGPRETVFVLAVYAVGPGLLVNAVFKDHWGRARPRDVVEFGGTKRFTPPALPTDQCQDNCSFTAGHPAAIFALGALALLARPGRRIRYLVVIALAGGTVGLVRVLQGGHFVSDVIFSALVVALTIVFLGRLIAPRARDAPRTP